MKTKFFLLILFVLLLNVSLLVSTAPRRGRGHAGFIDQAVNAPLALNDQPVFYYNGNFESLDSNKVLMYWRSHDFNYINSCGGRVSKSTKKHGGIYSAYVSQVISSKYPVFKLAGIEQHLPMVVAKMNKVGAYIWSEKADNPIEVGIWDSYYSSVANRIVDGLRVVKTVTVSAKEKWTYIEVALDALANPFLGKTTIKFISRKSPFYIDDVVMDAIDYFKMKAQCQVITSTFENSSKKLAYTYAENIGDGRGITFGFPGFCSGTYDGTIFVKRYQQLNSSNILVKYIPAFEAIDKKPHPDGKCADTTGLANFPKDFATCGNDPLFRQAQMDIVDNLYWEPALKKAKQIGMKKMVSLAQFYDSAINHGATGNANDKGLTQFIDETTAAMGGTPATGINEKSWLVKFMEKRRAWFNEPGNEEWLEAIARLDAFDTFLDNSNLDLTLPLSYQGYEGDGNNGTWTIIAADLIIY